MQLAWHIAVMQRAKKVPKLATLLVKPPGRQVQTWQQQQAVMDQWAMHTRRIHQIRQQQVKKLEKGKRKRNG